jgi:dihydroorotase
MPRLPERIEMSPGLDPHVHFREPSPLNLSETFASGTEAAREGGFLAVADMPNNEGAPTWTEVAVLDKRGRITGTAKVYVGENVGCQPHQNTENELEKMVRLALSLKSYMGPTTGNRERYDEGDFKDIHAEWHRAGPELPIMVHRGDADIEEIIGFICGQLKHPLHVCHVNSMEEVMAVKRAKTKGYPVTCGVCPHHLFMTTHDEKTKGEFAEMKPPLAHEAEAEELWDALVKGDIDLLETDHAPHAYEAKIEAEASKIREDEHPKDCFGVPGIQEAIPMMLYQAARGRISLERVEEVTSTVPARLLGINISPRSKAIWSNELYRIPEYDPRRPYVSPYVGNLAVGKVQQINDKDGVIFVRDKYEKKVIKPFITRGATI